MMLHGDYDAGGLGVPLTDAEISAAVLFRGWSPEFMTWHGALGDSADELDRTPAHNAYHCQRLGLAMLDVGGWIGPTLQILKCGGVRDGNHRWRALLWIFPAFARPVNEWSRFEILRRYSPTIELLDAPAWCWRGAKCPSKRGKL